MTFIPSRRRCLGAALGGLACATLTHRARAQSFPHRPVRIIVPYPTGGFNDTLARLASGGLSERWGQPVIVENRPGAGTIIGTQAAAEATPDGHTMFVAQFPFAVNPWLYRNLPYDSARTFAPVMLAGHSPMMLLTHARSPLRTLDDVLQAARRAPGGLNYGSSGPGSSQHLAMVLFEQRAGVHLNQVPYRGSTPLLMDLAGGQIDLAVDLLPHALPFIKGGRLRALAMATPERSPLMPELPTAQELGVPGFHAAGWHGFLVPAGTPPALVDTLSRDLNAILTRDEVQATFAQQGVSADGGSPGVFQAFIAEQMALWQRVIQQAGIEPA